ncbi:MAG: single-stranded-DNA-specific exonuclease RecJ [Solirubrobacterales bacterium]
MSAAAARAFHLEPYDYGEARALAEGLGIAEPVAVTLVRRGYRTVPEARAFLDARDDHDPFGFEAMSEVVDRIGVAVSAGRRITVHGDYDVDGVCSTAILVRTLRAIGADCDWLIPDRLGDGYGLTAATVDALATRGTALLVTTDCGIGSADEVAAAQAAGIEVIVTDHHQPSERLPECPILHPAVSGYPFTELCGTGVAYKLAAALRGADAVRAELDLVALATVADLVPLRGENRALVRRGLAEARQVRRPGLRALMAAAGVSPERLDEGDFAFRLAPRINAAGRLYRADAGVELMLTDDDGRATAIAAELDRANLERREVEREVLRGAEAELRKLPHELADAPGLVLAGQGWHPGVVGIVASRLAESQWRPVVLVGLDANGAGRGSGRSVPGFDLLAALTACDRHLVRYGGHRAAAGLEIEAGELEAFRRAFAEAAGAQLGGEPPVRTETVDAVVGGESLGHDVAEQLARLAPFGPGNPGVRLLVPGAQLADVRPMGEGERHARFALHSGPARALGVAFGVNGELDAAARSGPVDVSVELELNQWNGAVEPRVVLGELYPLDDQRASPDPAPAIGADEFWSRHQAELTVSLSEWPPAELREFVRGPRREPVKRWRGSGVATIAGLASSGAGVLVICADAPRRCELIERAARPARFGGGELAIVSGRLPDATALIARSLGAAGGVALADWAALGRDPALATTFEHCVVVDPPPYPHLEALAAAGEGYLHRVDGQAETEFALRVHAEEWPSRASLAVLFRAIRDRCGGAASLDAAAARRTVCGEGRRHPFSPEVAARSTRVLVELGVLEWDSNGRSASLGVVSSGGADLNRSEAFVAYRDRCEEGRRFLSEQRQT